MVTITREAQSATKKQDAATIKQEILQRIPQYEIHSIIRRHHLQRTFLLGLIGNRGDGKSGSGASISLVDFMLEGWPCYSNMPISCDIVIDDVTARKYGLDTGGIAHYESLPLDKERLLCFDEIFHNSVIFGDEINMELADARRSMSNTNLWSMNIAQELRHLEAHLIYTVIDEMFIDTRLRTMTDVFLKCEDTALSVEGLSNHQQEGLNIKWSPYAMSGYLAGRENSYYVTHKPLPPVYFKFGLFHGIYDDKYLQATGKPKYGVKFKKDGDIGELEADLQVDTSEQDRQFDEYRWLIERVTEIRDRGLNNLTKYQLSQLLGVVIDDKMSRLLPNFGISYDTVSRSYIVENWRIEDSVGMSAAAQT